MPEPRLMSIGRAVPAESMTQLEVEAYSPFERTALTDKLLHSPAICTRGLFVPPSFYDRPRTLTETNAAWRTGAMALGGQALTDALVRAECDATSLDVIGVTTVTGYTTPGLDLLLARAHGMRPDIQRVHFNCIGCHAAIPLLRVLADHVARRPNQLAAGVAVEICSACFAFDDDPQNLVASSLFGDGAASVVIGTGGDGPILADFRSAFDFAHIDALGFELGSDGFRIVLDPTIPDHVGSAVGGVITALLADNGLTIDDVAIWALHPGGARILDVVQRALGLSDDALRPSRRVLRDHGNMSSPTVLFVLAEALARTPVRPGQVGVLAAFGPGLGIETALLRF